MKQQSLALQQQFVAGATGGSLSLSDISSGSGGSGSGASSDLGSLLGPSASQVGEDGTKAALEAQLKALKAKLANAGGADPYADRKDSSGRCKWCLRTECLFLTGGKACREYNQAMNFLGEQRAQRRKAAAEEAASSVDAKE